MLCYGLLVAALAAPARVAHAIVAAGEELRARARDEQVDNARLQASDACGWKPEVVRHAAAAQPGPASKKRAQGAEHVSASWVLNIN
jgi:hypothetical protein